MNLPVLPPFGRILNPDGGEEPDAAFPRENAREERLVHADELGGLGLVQSEIVDPLLESPERPAEVHGKGINMTVAPVKNICGKPATVKPSSEDVRAQKRYVSLVEELIAEYAAASGRENPRSREWGALSHVAEALGVSQPTLSKILSGSRQAGTSVVRRAIKRLRIRDEFFYGAREPATYRDFVARGKEPIFAAWRRFVEEPESGATMTPSERETIAMSVVPEGREPTVAFYAAHLFALRNLLTRAELGRVVEKTHEVQRESDARRKPPSDPNKGS